MTQYKKGISWILIKIARSIASRLPFTQQRELMSWLAIDLVVNAPPEIAIKELLVLDNFLYPLHGELAIKLYSGIHPKHELTSYHDFFVNRIRQGEKVLDFGCGVGALAYDLADLGGAHVDAIDVSEERINIARQRHPHRNISYIHGDGLNHPLISNCETIVMSNVLEHLDGRPKVLRDLQEKTRTKRFLIRVPLFQRDWRVAFKKQLGLDWRLDEDHKIEYTPESFAEEMIASGQEIVSIEIRWGEIWAEVRNKGPLQ